MVEISSRLMVVLEDFFPSPFYDVFLNSSSSLVDGKRLPVNATDSSLTQNEYISFMTTCFLAIVSPLKGIGGFLARKRPRTPSSKLVPTHTAILIQRQKTPSAEIAALSTITIFTRLHFSPFLKPKFQISHLEAQNLNPFCSSQSTPIHISATEQKPKQEH